MPETELPVKSRQAGPQTSPRRPVPLPAGTILTTQIGEATLRATVARHEPGHSHGNVPMRSATQHRRLTGATDVTVLVHPTPDASGAR